jgi:hypothetical protein
MRRRPHLEAAFDRFNKAMQRPEAQRFFAELRAKRPPELDEQWPAIRSYLDGDAEPLRAFVKKHVGAALEQASSSYVFPALEGKDIGASTNGRLGSSSSTIELGLKQEGP